MTLIVKDSAGQKLAYVYFEDESGRSGEIANAGAADCGEYCEVACVATLVGSETQRS
jgi:hypothetical protein